MELSIAIIVTVTAIIFSGLFSGTEIAFMQSNKVKMEIDATRGGIVNRIIHGFTRHADMFISTLLVGNNVVLVIYGISISAIINPFLERFFHNDALMLISNTAVSTLIILLTGEFLPKTVFRINPNAMMRMLALPLSVIYIVLYPVSLLTSWISRAMMKIFGIRGGEAETGLLTIDQIDDYLQRTIEQRPEDSPVENEVKIFRNAIDFKDTKISECMTPRNEIIAVNIDTASTADLIAKFIETGLSKIVAYKDDIDNIQGYIHVSELFTCGEKWSRRLKPVIFSPESMLAQKMMSRLLAEKRSMAVIIDEFGGTAGLVTLEDLVEEIFGETDDEHDRRRPLARRTKNGDLELSGRAEIEMLNEEFGLDIRESEDYHTLAGYILDSLEALPSQGDTFRIGSLSFTVLKMSATRIEQVLVRRIPETEGE